MRLHRRNLLKGVGAGIAASRMTGLAWAQQAQGLKDRAAARGMIFGMAVRDTILSDEPAYGAAVAREAGMIVPENEMKWGAVSPAPGAEDFGAADRIASFAADHAIPLRGHTAVWHQHLPAWTADKLSGEGGRKLVLDHVTSIVDHFRGRVKQWDVVNEAIHPPDKQNGLLRNWPPYNEGGYAFIADCFHAAHEADPDALLYYNDFGTEYPGIGFDLRREGILRLLGEMKERKAPIHGMGVQSHLTIGNDFSESTFRRFLADVASLGIHVMLTELDVNDRRIQGSVEHRDQLAADTVRQYLDVAFDQPAVEGLLTWGVGDAHTWLNAFLPRVDGAGQRSLPLDMDYKPTPMWTAIAECFDNAPRRS